jgi:predicted nucleic acid-binding protein
MNLFFDTSAFVKRYIDESGSDEIEELCTGADDVGVSILLPIEIVSAFSRLKREKRITEKEYTNLKEELFTDLRDITVISLSPAIVKTAIDSIERSPLKTFDATHIGCALEYQPDFFVSSDIQQLHAAGRAGLKTKKILESYES